MVFAPLVVEYLRRYPEMRVDVVTDGRLVDVHIRRLRTKIETDPANPRHILTVRGMGYKLAS